MRRVRVGLAQVNPAVGAVETNARLVIDWIDRVFDENRYFQPIGIKITPRAFGRDWRTPI